MAEDEDSVARFFREQEELQNSQRSLMAILGEFKERTGEAGMICNEEGKVFVHPDVRAKLDESGNEGALEFLRFMQRTGITKPDESDFS